MYTLVQVRVLHGDIAGFHTPVQPPCRNDDKTPVHLQNERQGNDGNFAAFLVNSIRMQPDARSIRIFLMGAFLASIGVGLVVYSLLGGQTALQSCCGAVPVTGLLGCCSAPLVTCCHELQTCVRAPAPSLGPQRTSFLAAGVCCKHEHDDAAQQFIAAGQQPLKLQTVRTPQPDCGRHKAYKIQLNTKWLPRPSRSGKFVVRPRRKLVRLLKARVCKQ
jgi:hypothetical protein